MSSISCFQPSPYFGLSMSKLSNAMKKASPMPKEPEPSEGDRFDAKRTNVPLVDQAAQGIRQVRELMEGIRADLEKGPVVYLRSEENDGIHKIHFKLGSNQYTIREMGDTHWEVKKKVTQRVSSVNLYRLEAEEKGGKASFFIEKKGQPLTRFINCESPSVVQEVKSLGKDILKALKESMPSSMQD